MRHHLFLLRELVRRDFQGRYAGSLLGFLWSFVQPLWLLLLFTFVFSTVMKISLLGERTGNFGIFLFCGLLPWTAVHEGVLRSSTAITDNAELVKKLRFPSRIPVLVAAVALFLAHAASFWHYVNDDAYITFRYSRMLAQGLGPYFNPGDPVEGYTNFLLMLLLAGVAWLGEAAWLPPVAKALGVVSAAGSVLVAAALAGEGARGWPPLAAQAGAVSAVAAFLVAASTCVAVNATSGLETAPFGLLIALGVWLGLRARRRGRWAGAGLAFAAAALTRPEGVAVFAVAWLALVLTGGGRGIGRLPRLPRPDRGLWLDALLVGTVVAGHLAFRYAAYDGQWLPNTWYAKAGGFWGVSPWLYVRGGLALPFLWAPGLAVGFSGAALAARRRPAFAVVPAVAATGGLLPFAVGTDWMVGFRFLAPFVPVTAAAVAVGWGVALCAALGRLPRVPRGVLPAALAAAVLGAGAAQLPLHRVIAGATRLRAQGYETGHRALAAWLCGDGRARPGDTIALMDVGIVGFTCIEQTILDISGLTDRLIGRSPGRFLAKRYDPAYVLGRRPRFVVLVLTTPGRAYEPPPAGAVWRTGTAPERRLYEDPAFAERYRRPPPAGRGPSAKAGDWRERLAREIGARRIFEHADVGIHYLLAVFEDRRQSERSSRWRGEWPALG